MSAARAVPRRLAPVVVAAAALALTFVTATPVAAAPADRSAVTLDVQSYNLDLGADLTPLFGATSVPGLVTAAATVYANVQASLPAERMAAIARIIAKQRPDAVGLQEVAQWATAPYALVSGAPVATGAYTTTYDFLGLLTDALTAEGLSYDVAATDVTFNSQSALAPIAIPISASLAARYIDRNVVLVRHSSQLTASNPQDGNFAVTFGVNLLGRSIAVSRGWASVDLTQRNRTFRFFDTHLEAYGVPGTLKDQIRNPQAVELAARVTASPYPTVVVGDINARPTMCATWRTPAPLFEDANVAAYGTLVAAGLTESWPAVHPTAPCDPASWTSGQSSLAGPTSTLNHRIDVVFASSDFTALQSLVVGDSAAELSEPHGLWPSDHASTVAKLRLDAAR